MCIAHLSNCEYTLSLCGSDWSNEINASNSSMAEMQINSVIFSVDLFSSKCAVQTDNLSQPVTISLHYINSSYSEPICAFLNDQDLRCLHVG